MRRAFFVVNPIAGSGNGAKTLEALLRLLKERSADFDYVYSERPFHATELARAALERGEKCIVAVGGDGTVREVAEALIHTDAALGLIPCGTGNDLARALCIPFDVERALGILLESPTRRMDAGLANGRCFLNVGGFGFDTDVVIHTEQYKKRFNGMFPYMMGILTTLLRPRRFELHGEADGVPFTENALFIAAANGTHFAGGMNLAPQSSPFDGTLDICLLRAIGLIPFLSLLPRFIKGKHLDSPHIKYFKAKRLTVTSETPSDVELDGELLGKTPVEFTVQPGALEVVAPA